METETTVGLKKMMEDLVAEARMLGNILSSSAIIRPRTEAGQEKSFLDEP